MLVEHTRFQLVRDPDRDEDDDDDDRKYLEDRLRSCPRPGLSLIFLDPLRKFALPTAETDNAAADQTIEALAQFGGREPVKIASHHTNAVSRGTKSPSSRGVSALVDASRWVATFRIPDDDSDDERGFFRLKKSNYSRPMKRELELVLGPGTARLWVPGKKDAVAKPMAESGAGDAEKIRALEASYIEALEHHGPIRGQRALRALIKGNSTLKARALRNLLEDHRIVCSGAEYDLDRVPVSQCVPSVFQPCPENTGNVPPKACSAPVPPLRDVGHTGARNTLPSGPDRSPGARNVVPLEASPPANGVARSSSFLARRGR
jgi:hypothetical protein